MVSWEKAPYFVKKKNSEGNVYLLLTTVVVHACAAASAVTGGELTWAWALRRIACVVKSRQPAWPSNYYQRNALCGLLSLRVAGEVEKPCLVLFCEHGLPFSGGMESNASLYTSFSQAFSSYSSLFRKEEKRQKRVTKPMGR